MTVDLERMMQEARNAEAASRQYLKEAQQAASEGWERGGQIAGDNARANARAAQISRQQIADVFSRGMALGI